MNKIDTYLYKKSENIENKSIPILIVFFVISINIGSVFITIWLLAKFLPERPFLYLCLYILLLLFTYYISKFSKFAQFIITNHLRKKILLENEKGKSITEWRYTKGEWLDFKQKQTSSVKKQRLKNYSILLCICLIFFITLELSLSLMFITIIIFFLIFSLNLTNIYSQNWKRILEKEEVNVIFSESGIVISKLYTYPSIIENRRLIKVRNDEQKNTIIFEYSIFSPGGLDSNDYVYTENITFPVIEKYKLDINKILKKTNTYNAFKIKQ